MHSSMRCIILLVVLAALLPVCRSYIPATPPPALPSLDPLQYITPQAIAAYIIDSTKRGVISAVIPVDSSEALAIFVSEGVSGFLGGAVKTGLSRLDGNRNREGNELINAGASGAFFGISGAIRSLATIAGASQFSVSFLSLVISLVVSEVIKVRGRVIESQRTRAGQDGPTMYDLMRFKQPSMLDLMRFKKTGDMPVPRMPMFGKVTKNELYADASQWLLLSIFVPSGPLAYVTLEDSVIIGAWVGIASQLVREANDRELEQRRRGLKKDFAVTRFARASFEGAGQLVTYEAARDYVREVSPYFQASSAATAAAAATATATATAAATAATVSGGQEGDLLYRFIHMFF